MELRTTGTARHRLGLALSLPAAALLFVGTAGTTTGCGKDPPAASNSSPAPGGDEEDTEPTGDGLDDGSDGVPPPIPGGGADVTPIPTKIRYVLVLVKENHSFDNYFAGFPGATSSMKAKLSTGKTITRPIAPDTKLSQDICHSNTCGKRAYAGGAMNGFDLNKAGNLPFIRYTEEQIPNYWQYARNFVLADHVFSTSLGPSTPGHAVFWMGRSVSIANAKCKLANGDDCPSSGGCTANPRTTILSYDPIACTTKTVPPCFDIPTLPDHLPSGFTWTNYGTPHALLAKSVSATPGYNVHFRKQGDLIGDLSGGHIANLTIAHILGSVSEHPDQRPCEGENFSVQVINAAMKLPQWKEMAIVLTWDDWGGFYDSVKPPVTACPNSEHFQSGFRVPVIVMSPYAKKGYVLKTPANQASVPRLVEELWGMEFMTARDPRALDGTSGSLMDAFDFNQAPRAPLMLNTRACPK